jgi:hypothetical protein
MIFKFASQAGSAHTGSAKRAQPSVRSAIRPDLAGRSVVSPLVSGARLLSAVPVFLLTCTRSNLWNIYRSYVFTHSPWPPTPPASPRQLWANTRPPCKRNQTGVGMYYYYRVLCRLRIYSSSDVRNIFCIPLYDYVPTLFEHIWCLIIIWALVSIMLLIKHVVDETYAQCDYYDRVWSDYPSSNNIGFRG